MNRGQSVFLYIVFGLLSCILFSLLFFQTLGKYPVIADDVLRGTLNRYPNIVTGIHASRLVFPELSYRQSPGPVYGYKKGKHIPYSAFYFGKNRFPVMLQQRQGGLPFYLLKLFSGFFGPSRGFVYYKLTTSLLIILLTGWVFLRFRGPALSATGMLFLSTDPIHIFSCAISISEPFLKIIALLGTGLLLGKNKSSIFLAGILFGLGLYIKITVLWFLCALAILFYTSLRFKKNLLVFIKGFLLIAVPVGIFLWDWSALIEEVSPKPFYRYPFVDFYNLIANKTVYCSLISDPLFFEKSRGLGIRLFNIHFPGFLLLLVFFIPFYARFLLKTDAFSIKRYFRFYLSLLAFLCAIWISTIGEKLHLTYLKDLYPLAVLLFSMIIINLWEWLNQNKGKVYASFAAFFLIAIPHLSQTADWIRYYREHRMFAQFDAKLLEQIAGDLENRSVFHPFTLEDDIGFYEFISKENIRPVHFYQLLAYTNSSLKTVPEILNFLKRGTMVIPLDTFPLIRLDLDINPDQIRKQASLFGIKISCEKFYKAEKRPSGIWVFDFDQITESSPSVQEFPSRIDAS